MRQLYRYPLALLALLLAAPALAQSARVQVVHNAADPAAAVVDVYIEEVSTEEPAIPDFAFRTATPFIDLPAGAELTVTVAPGNSTSAEDGLASFTYTLEDGAAYQLIATGVLDPSQFEANPDGVDIGFTLLVNAGALEEASSGEVVSLAVVHGATDAPAVDVVARGVGTLVDDAAYGDVTDYFGVPAGAYTLDVTTADGGAVAATFAADLGGAAGTALKVLASGFLSPGDDQGGPAFGLLAVFPDGTTALLPEGAVSAEDGAAAGRFEVGALYPNPLREAATLRFRAPADAEVRLEVFDVLGRRVLAPAAQRVAADAEGALSVEAAGLPAGVYLYRVSADAAAQTWTETGRMTVVR